MPNFEMPAASHAEEEKKQGLIKGFTQEESDAITAGKGDALLDGIEQKARETENPQAYLKGVLEHLEEAMEDNADDMENDIRDSIESGTEGPSFASHQARLQVSRNIDQFHQKIESSLE